LKLMQAKGRVILKLPQKERDQLPQGEVAVMIEGEEYIARFAKEYVNVLRLGESNVLSELMRGWFGSRAGERGTKHEVRVWNDGVWRMGKS
jgi:hypothetical protein